MNNYWFNVHKKFCVELIIRAVWLLLLLCIGFNNSGCKKLDIKRINKITTGKPESNSLNQITVKAEIIDFNNEQEIISFGHCWSTSSNPTIENACTSVNGSEIMQGTFTSQLANIKPGQKYYLRAYIRNNESVTYSKEVDFTFDIPTLSLKADSISILSYSSVKVNGSIENIGSYHVLNFGHVWSTNTNPTINDFYSGNDELTSDTSFYTTISNLNKSTYYYLRTFVQITSSSYLYSDAISFIIPELEITTDSSSVTASTSIKLMGSITSLGIDSVSDYGFCWSYTSSNPNYNGNLISLGSINKVVQFNSTMQNIQQGVTYYYRAYAIEDGVIKYGTIKNFIL